MKTTTISKRLGLTRMLGAGIATLCVSSSAFANFINGGFESGNTSGWTIGGGNRTGLGNAAINPTDFLPGGSRYDAGIASSHSAVVTAGIADHTDGNLNRVNQTFGGTYSFRAEDTINGGYASVITQRVDNYTDTNIFFAWAAVLEGAHGTDEAATFKLVLRDETAGTDLITRQYNAANSGGGVDSRFTLSSDGFYYTSWQVEQLALDSSIVGHDFTLTLLAADCQFTGHEGEVYLDGFGAIPPPPPPIPLPGTLALLGLGLA